MFARVDRHLNSADIAAHNDNVDQQNEINEKEEEEVHHDLTHHSLNVVRSQDADDEEDDDERYRTPTKIVPRGIRNKFGAATAPFRRLSQYDKVGGGMMEHDDEGEKNERYHHSYHGAGDVLYPYHSNNRNDNSHRSITPSTFDGTTTLGSSSAAGTANTTKTGAADHDHYDEQHRRHEENAAATSKRNDNIHHHEHDDSESHNNHNDLLHIDFDSDMEDIEDEDGVQRYAFDFSSSHNAHHSPMALPQSSFSDSLTGGGVGNDDRIRTLSTCSSEHDPRIPLTATTAVAHKSSFNSSLQSSSSHNQQQDHHHHHHQQHSFSSIHSSSTHHSNPNYPPPPTPPHLSPLIKIASSIRQARIETKRRRAERILALSDTEVQTPLGLALTHTRLCLSSWCDLFDRGYVLLIIFVVVLVGLYVVLDGEENAGTKRALIMVGLPVVVVRVCWRHIYWFIWGRRIEKRRQERMQLYDGLNGAHGTGGIEIPSMMMGQNSIHEMYSDEIPRNDDGTAGGNIEDGFENEDHHAVVGNTMKRYSDKIMMEDNHHHKQQENADDIHDDDDDESGQSDGHEHESHDGQMDPYSDELIMNPLPFDADADDDDHHQNQEDGNGESSGSNQHFDENDDEHESTGHDDVGSNLPCPV